MVCSFENGRVSHTSDALAEFSARLLPLVLLNAVLTFGYGSVSSLLGLHGVLLRIICSPLTKGMECDDGDLPLKGLECEILTLSSEEQDIWAF